MDGGSVHDYDSTALTGRKKGGIVSSALDVARRYMFGGKVGYADGGSTDVAMLAREGARRRMPLNDRVDKLQQRWDQRRQMSPPGVEVPWPAPGNRMVGLDSFPATDWRNPVPPFMGAADPLEVYGYADGGIVSGPIVGDTGGREDAKPVSVENGAYVVPADVVAALGEGNSGAGHKALERQFGPSQPTMAGGGAVPIRISDGEHVLSHEQVAKIGGGDHAKGCKILDHLVTKVRAENIKHLKGLPGPAKG